MISLRASLLLKSPELDGNLNDDRHQLSDEDVARFRTSPAYTHNNPGHLKFRGQPDAEQGDEASDGQGYWAKYKTSEVGIRDMMRDIIDIKMVGKSSHIKKTDTLKDFLKVYSATDIDSYLKIVNKLTGLPGDISLEDIPKDRYNRLIRAMIRKENVQFYKENIDTINKLLPEEEKKLLVTDTLERPSSLLELLRAKYGNTSQSSQE